MKLNGVFEYYSPLGIIGDSNVDITNIATHSKTIKPGGLFFAIKGEKTDGCKFVQDAVKNGAVAVVTDRKIEYKNVVTVFVDDINRALSRWSSAFYGFPSKEMEIVGVEYKKKGPGFPQVDLKRDLIKWVNSKREEE